MSEHIKSKYDELLKWFSENKEAAAIICEFNGEGDSGSIESAFAVSDYHECNIEQSRRGDSVPDSAAEEVAYAALEEQGVDWYNNDGGFGHVAIFPDGKIKCVTNARYTESTEHKATFKLSASGFTPEGEAE